MLLRHATHIVCIYPQVIVCCVKILSWWIKFTHNKEEFWHVIYWEYIVWPRYCSEHNRVYVESNIHYWVISFLWNLVNHPNYPFDPDKGCSKNPKLLDLWCGLKAEIMKLMICKTELSHYITIMCVECRCLMAFTDYILRFFRFFDHPVVQRFLLQFWFDKCPLCWQNINENLAINFIRSRSTANFYLIFRS